MPGIIAVMGNDGVGNIIAVLALVVSALSFISACVIGNRSKWDAAMKFLSEFDSEGLRKDRKKVYDYLNEHEGKLEDVKSDSETEKALTRVIAYYDGAAHLALNHFIPMELFEASTLFTAAYFYEKTKGYMNDRRTSETDCNPLYACFYAKLMNKNCIKKKIKKMRKTVNNYRNKYYDGENYSNTIEELTKLDENTKEKQKADNTTPPISKGEDETHVVEASK